VRSARLGGVAHVGGAVLGRAAVVPTVTAFDGMPRFGRGGEGDAGPAEQRLERAFARLREDLARAVRRIGDAQDPAIGGALDRFALALCDARLRERLVAAADRPAGLRAVAKEYARAPYRLGASRAEAGEQAAELEELCALLGDARTLRPGSVWLGDRLHTFVAILAVSRNAAALVASDAIAPAAIAIARAVRMPVVSDVAGLFGWARPGDLLGIDGDRGAVLVHPAATDIERLRRAR
jgi:signal transduction protein with GAF and PtsI domain